MSANGSGNGTKVIPSGVRHLRRFIEVARQLTKRKPTKEELQEERIAALQREIAGLLLMALGGVCLLALLSATRGLLSDMAAQILRQSVGWGAYLASLGLMALVVFVGLSFLFGMAPYTPSKNSIGFWPSANRT